MSVVITNGQSWAEIAEMLTLSKDYAPAIAAQSNMDGEDITGKRFRLEIPDNWMKPEYSGKTITLAKAAMASPSSNWMIYIGVGLLAMIALKKRF